ncbi:U-box domain-containing protein 38-like [Andrographis paniculata]|uniref:U-box domain-containing protein 38-like n=1 Tax=Andrographis paniculata TaxID=175694 RepID=UPI0021E9416F|nr:U-box domain-containing protein 38-like [Andrographis paniculata]
MAGNRRLRRWRINFFYRSSANSKDPPKEFVCPISNSLMFDPAVVSSGQTFEQLCVDVCRDLGFAPTLRDGSTPDFSTAIPNLALKSAIENWCLKSGLEFPKPPVYSDVESIVRSRSGSAASGKEEKSEIRYLERELLNGVTEKAPILLSHAASELNRRNLYESSSDDESEESVIANATPLLPFATRPSCFSHCSSSPSVSSEFFSDEASSNYFSASSSISPSEDEDFVTQMNSLDVYDQEQAVILLRKTTRTEEDSRTSLCTERLLMALKKLLTSRYAAVQSNAAAAIVNISLERCNKIKIVRAGIVPILIEVLKNGFEESREHAAGAIFSLAIEDENKTAIGVLGALPPLLHLLRSGTRRSRRDAALALYHLTLVQSNRKKIIKLGATAVLVALLADREAAEAVVLVLCNLAACGDGRAALLDADAVERLMAVLRNRSESYSETTRENCIAALHSLSHANSRFKAMARSAGGVEVLRAVAETGSERAREKARRILAGLRRRQAAETEEVDWEAVMKGGVAQMRFRAGASCERNSTEF